MNPNNPVNSLFFRSSFFAALCTAGIAVFWRPLRDLAVFSFADDLYSHIGLIPLFCIALIFLKRRDIFSRIGFSTAVGAAVILSGLILLVIGKTYRPELEADDYLALCTSGFVFWMVGAFVGIYGVRAFRRAMFPLLFLFFFVPFPTIVLNRSIEFLQHMTADTVDGVLGCIGLPYFRSDLVFQLPEVTIQVAEQCSGIRSSLALIVATTAAGYVFLETGWRRLLLVLAIIPITIFKNALRITTLTLLASHVDTTWLTDSWLHKAGGKPFFLIALLLWSPILWVLWRSEKGLKQRTQSAGHAAVVSE
jgi:exosortase